MMFFGALIWLTQQIEFIVILVVLFLIILNNFKKF